MLEMSTRRPDTDITLGAWMQGADLRGHKVNVPEIRSRRLQGRNEYVWEENDNRTQRLPVEPDALFSLHFSGGRQSHFCYEADRGTMPLAEILKKLRAYHHFIKRQQNHKEAFGVHPIRAVLIETTDEQRARKMMELAQHAAVLGEGRRTALFWFVISRVFTAPVDGVGRTAHLVDPRVILDPVWALPDFTMHSLMDVEN